jgi:hypothetical protein
VTIPAIMPGQDARVEVPVYFGQKPEQIDEDGFKVVGTYMDRSQRRQYDVIAEWDSSPT